MDVVCVALGGLGSSFDQLAMNRELLVKYGVNLRVSFMTANDERKAKNCC